MPEGTCKIEGCAKRTKTLGWCGMHYERFRNHGSTDDPRPYRPEVCVIDGCEARPVGRGWCSLHYQRWQLKGDPLGDVPRRVYAGVSMHTEGYRLVSRPGHPLAQADRYVPEHRLVLWESLAGADAPCHWCAEPVSWALKWPRDRWALVVDHLDGDKLNNDIGNLVPSCNPCNSTRSTRKHPEAA
jgi:hypothetical protein